MNALAVTTSVSSDDVVAEVARVGMRAGAPKIRRFLDPMALPALVASNLALDGLETDPATGRLALCCVSAWDPTYLQPDGVDETFGAVARYYRDEASPTSWLRKMVNNALCQIAIAHGINGPNQHFVGRADGVAAALVFGQSFLSSGVVDEFLVVAFDPADPALVSAYEPDGHAAAVRLRRSDAQPALDTLPDTDAVSAVEAIGAGGSIDPVAAFRSRTIRPIDRRVA